MKYRYRHRRLHFFFHEYNNNFYIESRTNNTPPDLVSDIMYDRWIKYGSRTVCTTGTMEILSFPAPVTHTVTRMYYMHGFHYFG